MSGITSADAGLLSFLARAGLLTSDQVHAAEAAIATKSKGMSPVEWAARNNIATEDELAQAIAGRLRLPYVNLAALALDPVVTKMVREDLATRYKVIPLRVAEDRLVIATANPLDREALRAVEFATRRRVQAAVATPTAVRDALQHAYHLDQALNQYLQGVPDDNELPVAELADDPTDVQSLIRETALPPVIKLSNLILVEGIRNGASDIHIEAGPAGVLVRYRVNGILEESFRLPKWVQDALIARCKVLAKLDITERRVPQDGRIRIRYRDSLIDLRVSSLPTQFGEKLTMRILDPTAAPRGLASIGLSPRDLDCIRQAITRPQGMVLVTGPTGSGKTTTLYGMLAEIISPTRNVVTIENPIEYQLRGVNQVEVNEKQGLTFAGTLRSILRQDPDVILVGEIRDAETAEIALRAAQTGHLVLSTLHTNDSVSTIIRLIDLGIEPFMLASSLHLIMGQRLVRCTCEHCSEPYTPEPAALKALRLPPGAPSYRRGRGCGACRKTGFSGRMAAFEVLPITRRIAALIESKATETDLRTQARAEGMCTLAEDGAQKVLAGLSTAEEMVRVVDVEDDARHCPVCHQAVEDSYVICPNCTTPLHTNCGGCGGRLQPQWRACPHCGAASNPPAAAKETPAAAALATVPAAPAPALATLRQTPKSAEGRQFHALVVDDEPDFLRLLSLALERSGMPISVEVAASGAEALACIEQQPPDLILLDVMMPQMDGYQVCEQLRSNVRTAFIPILMLTALDDPRHRARGFLAGTDDYIGKPFDRTELLARVRRVLERTYGSLAPARRLSLELSEWGPSPN
ncbi:MAG: Flp pilus assembly complex ATPase component TadA [Deltaproteobacteria bacterium]|nr:Flp pilus assembly complex ATPase component TadA [Deltaproteobacteria bacterium]